MDNVSNINAAPLDFDLDLKRGDASTRIVDIIAVERGRNGERLRELKFKAEFPTMTQTAYTSQASGMSSDEAVRAFTIAIWDLPFKNGEKTTQDQFNQSGQKIWSLIEQQPYIMNSLFKHLVQVVNEQSIDDLHRALRKGN